ncbi:hypothetical protein [Flammeovirga pacifica]|uniref:Methyltransferase domain-containing protein n=1 Tax=Flammeovirga pacifica TaxID=915059 RepID=A0A1S1YYK8_FLAPC|nr:hypothetical protein [Flammeovirga pacifica]OHX66087.1 hypothetical protein NH26_06855 [Flammeovirga pacifica]
MPNYNSIQEIAHTLHNDIRNNPNIDFNRINTLIDNVASDLRQKNNHKSELELIHQFLPHDFINDSLIGHLIQKPYGYPEDFRFLDGIHTNFISDNYPNWDQFLQNSSLAKSLRFRKQYFEKTIEDTLREKSKINALIIAADSGHLLPSTLKKYAKSMTVDILEWNDNAVHYNKVLTQKWLPNIRFFKNSFMNYHPEEKYDIVWIAGIFDYLDNHSFEEHLNRALSWKKNKGEIILVNFSPNNASKNIMEILLNWKVAHRSKTELINLAYHCGFHRSQIRLETDITKSNHFMHLHKNMVH